MSAVHFERDGRARCGTPGARLAAGEPGVTCLTCLSLMAGEGCRYDIRPCGTEAAYRRELRHGGPVHEECRRAANREAADRKARRQRKRKALAA